MTEQPNIAYVDAGALKLLSDNRLRYIEQSANTKDGTVAELPPDLLRRVECARSIA